MDIAALFLNSAIKRVSQYRELCEKAMRQLNDQDFYFRPNNECNNIATIIQHLSGNMKSRWTNFLEEDGEKPWRNRDLEFNDQGVTRARLMVLWDEGWECFLNTLRSLKPEDLTTTIYIRTEPIL